MKFAVRKRLNQRGFIHHIIPIVAFVALFAIVGAYFLLRGSLAAPTTVTYHYLESTVSGSTNLCITDYGSGAAIAQFNDCNGKVANATLTSVSGQDIIKINGHCLQTGTNSTGAVLANCDSRLAGQYWVFNNSKIEPADISASLCLGAVALGNQIETYPCSDKNIVYMTWKYATVVSTAPAPAAASSSPYYIESTSFAGYCLAYAHAQGSPSGPELEACQAVQAQYVDASVLGSTTKATIKVNGDCLQNGSNGVTFAGCNGGSAQAWNITSPTIKTTNTSTALCLGGSRYVAVTATDCGSTGESFELVLTTTPGTQQTTTPPATSTIPISEYFKTAPQDCFNYTYSTANINTAYYCVAALQTMLNGMKTYDGYNQTLAIDGQFGPDTKTSLVDYQDYENKSISNKITPANLGESTLKTWQFLCWSMVYRGLYTKTPTSQAYNYVECTQDKKTPGVKPYS